MRGFKHLFLGGVMGKALGIAREMLLAWAFGTSGAAAAYRVAQAATLIPVNFFTSEALSAGFLPNHSRLRSDDLAKAIVFYRAVNRLLMFVSVLLCLSLSFGAEWVVKMLVPGLSAGYQHLATSMLIVMALGVPAFVSTAIGSYAEMSYGSFWLQSVRASVQSIGLITGTLLAVATEAPLYLAWGFTAANFILAVITHARLRRLGILELPVSPSDFTLWSALRKFGRTMRPLMLVPFALQGTAAIERLVASLIDDSAIAALDYARLVTETAVILIAAPLGLTVLASHSSLAEEKSSDQLAKILRTGLALFVPASVLLALSAETLTSLIFERGAFESSSTQVTAAILVGLSVGLWARVGAHVMIKGLNARDRNRAAALTITVGSVATIAADFALYKHLGALTLGLGASIGGVVQFFVAANLHALLKPLTYRLMLNVPGIVLAIVGYYGISDVGEVLASALAAAVLVGWGLVCRPLREDTMRLLRRLRPGR